MSDPEWPADDNEVVGHKTMSNPDGSLRHEPLTAAEARSFWEASERQKEARAALMPDEQSAIDAMFEAWVRLKELGWREAQYCPKDGSSFDVIEPGSTGIFRGHYSGDWPDGTWWLEDAHDLWPSRPILFRLDPEAEAARRQKMVEARARYEADHPEDAIMRRDL
jgi:hypothetical protein